MRDSDLPIRNIGRGKKPWQLDLRFVGGPRKCFANKALAEGARQSALRDWKLLGKKAAALSDEEKLSIVRTRDQLKDLGATIEQCVEFFAKHHTAAEEIKFSTAIERVADVKRAANLNAVYIRKFVSHLKSLMAETGDEPLHRITRDQIEGWLFKPGRNPVTTRSLRIDVRTFFRYAQERNWIGVNPALRIAAVKLPESAPGILTVDECRALLGACRPLEVLPFVVLNLLCGLRPEECVQISPANIRETYVEIPATVAKGRRRRIVELSENAREWLRIAPEISKRSPKWYARQIPRMQLAASKILKRPLPWPKNCLRHSFASYHLAAHGSADKTATQMGHRSTDMLFRHYRELVTREQAEAFWKIYPGRDSEGK